MSYPEHHRYHERREHCECREHDRHQPKSFDPHYLFYKFCHRRVELYHDVAVKYNIAPLPKCYLRDAKHHSYK